MSFQCSVFRFEQISLLVRFHSNDTFNVVSVLCHLFSCCVLFMYKSFVFVSHLSFTFDGLVFNILCMSRIPSMGHHVLYNTSWELREWWAMCKLNIIISVEERKLWKYSECVERFSILNVSVIRKSYKNVQNKNKNQTNGIEEIKMENGVCALCTIAEPNANGH